ncbi:MAG TPA: mannosyltransferase family protein [Solirubrobacteraceae bacterium]
MALRGRPAAALPRVRLPRGGAEALRIAWRATLFSRLLVWGAGVGALLVWGNSARARDFDPSGLTAPFGAFGDALVAPAARWDSVWYLSIAQDGYGAQGRPAFFPLYPLLARVGGWVVGSPLVAGALVSTACLVAGLAALHELTRLELGGEAARWTVVGLAVSPMSFFFSAVYSESLFLALSAGALLAARRGRWWWAGALGAGAAATRSAGVVLLVPLVLLAWSARPRPMPRDALALALVPGGLVVFMAAMALGGHGALAPFHVQDVWFREWAGPFGGLPDAVVAAWDGARQLLSGQREDVYFTAAGGDPFHVARMNLMLFAFLLAALPALVGAARRLPLAYAAYALAALALPLSYPVGPQPLMSLPRFELVLLPLWMWWGAWLSRHPRARGPALALSAFGLAAFAAQFATWHWVA